MMSQGNDAIALAGVIGWPVAHSLSPILHHYWLRHLNRQGFYVPLAVRPQTLGEALRALNVLGFRGANITVPHKEAARTLVDRLEPTAKRIGAVNTVVVTSNGRLEGRNTDAYGFLANLDEAAPAWRERVRAALVLGAGGAARAVVVALLDAGLERIFLVNRTRARADSVADALADDRISPAGWADRSSLLKSADLVVNTTTLGMAGNPPLELNLSLLGEGSVVCDIVYRPLQTGLLKQAAARGVTCADGLGMLIHQAVPAFEAFFGIRPQVDEAARAHLLARMERA